MTTEGPPARIRDWLLGQDALLAQMDGTLRADRLAHAYLLLGPAGSGRTRTALALAQQFLCAGAEPPCGACPQCFQSARLIHPDLHVLQPMTREEVGDPERVGRGLEAYAADRYRLLGTARSAGIGIDRVRELREEVAKAMVMADRRVVVVIGAERMTEQAAQSALKLVEEPPPRTVILLTAEDPARLLPTLVSRCQRVQVRPLTAEMIRRVLETGLEVPAAESRLLASLASGSLGRALELREGHLLDWRDRVLEAFSPDAGPASTEARVAALEESWNPESARQAGDLLLIWLHDLMIARFLPAGGGAAGEFRGALVHSDRESELRRDAAEIPLREIRRRLAIVEEMVQAIGQNVNPTLALHAALSRIDLGPAEEEYPF